MTRYRMNLLLLAAVLGLTLAASGPAQGPGKGKGNGKADDNRQLVILGPYPLGELYLKTPHKDLRESIARGGGPATREIVKALNGCKVSILFEKERSGTDGKWRIAHRRSYPKAVIEGAFAFTLPDAGGKDFVIGIREVVLAADHFDNTWGRTARRCRSAITGSASRWTRARTAR